jgi:hypothetical protein
MNLSAALTSAFLCVVWLEASMSLREKKRRQPKLTWTVCLVLSLCLLAQLRYPHLLVLFQRSATQIFNGEWWRLLTALFFQDGWILGGLTNIALLFAIGNLAEQLWNRTDWIMIAVAGALTGELLTLSWEPTGAGNSIATCSLAGSLLILKTFRQASLSSKLLKSLALAICLVLVTLRDIHGAAALAGVVVGLTKSPRQ